MADLEGGAGRKSSQDLGTHIKKLSFENAYFIGCSLSVLSISVAVVVVYLSDFCNNPMSGNSFTDADNIIMEVGGTILLCALCIATVYTLKPATKKD